MEIPPADASRPEPVMVRIWQEAGKAVIITACNVDVD